MRTLVLILLSACSLNVDYTGTYYQCDPDGSCPDGFTCRAQVCVPNDPAPPACSAHVATGRGHSCAIREDGSAWCWGQNDFGQLGDNTATDSSLPVQVVTATGNFMDGTAIAGGDSFTCALDKMGAIWCWGHNDHGQLGGGTGDSRSAVQVPGITGAKAMAIGLTHACALLGDNTVSCWGQNADGELGDGSTADHAPMVVPGLASIAQISAGDSVTCSVDTAGAPKCWGDNEFGQLGTGNHTAHPTPTAVILDMPAVEILAGHGYSCATTTLGYTYCWGQGPLGNGVVTSQSDQPVVVASPTGFMHLTGGDNTVCGLVENGQVWCWGRNGDGRMADGSQTDQPSPELSMLTDVTEVSTNGAHLCAVDKRGAIRCAGFNRRGELGDGNRLTQPVPQKVPGLDKVMALTAGSNHTCALLVDGTVKCWGYGGDGQLGLGNFENSAVPRIVGGVGAVTQVSAGAQHTCAQIGDTAFCWGRNDSGQLSDGNGAYADSPQPIFGFGKIQKLFAGDHNTCALVNGEPFCVGDYSNTPSVFNGYGMSGSIGTGRAHGCVVLADHTVHCTAGDNYDATLGDGTTVCCTDSAPVTNATDVVIRGDQSCAVLADHSVKCWGYNSGGRLGVGVSDYLIKSPTAIPSLSTSGLSIGGDISCAVRMADSSIACWGSNYYGGIGDGTYGDHNAPVAVMGITATQVVAGDDHACALMSDATVSCWGNDNDGELGDGIEASPAPSGVRMVCP